MNLKTICLILFTYFSFAGPGTDSDTTRTVDINLFVSLKNKAIINGDFIQLENRDEYILKTSSRHLIITNFEIINKYRDLFKRINALKGEYSEDVTSQDVIEDNTLSIKPFDIDDF